MKVKKKHEQSLSPCRMTMMHLPIQRMEAMMWPGPVYESQIDIVSIVASPMLKQSKGEDEHEEFSATVAETVNEKGCPSRQGSVAT